MRQFRLHALSIVQMEQHGKFKWFAQFPRRTQRSGTKSQGLQLVAYSPYCGATLLTQAYYRYVNFGRVSKIAGRSIVYLMVPGWQVKRHFGKYSLWEMLERKNSGGRRDERFYSQKFPSHYSLYNTHCAVTSTFLTRLTICVWWVMDSCPRQSITLENFSPNLNQCLLPEGRKRIGLIKKRIKCSFHSVHM